MSESGYTYTQEELPAAETIRHMHTFADRGIRAVNRNVVKWKDEAPRPCTSSFIIKAFHGNILTEK